MREVHYCSFTNTGGRLRIVSIHQHNTERIVLYHPTAQLEHERTQAFQQKSNLFQSLAQQTQKKPTETFKKELMSGLQDRPFYIERQSLSDLPI